MKQKISKLLFLITLAWVPLLSSAQTTSAFTISGTVTDNESIPLIGASVIIDGTSIGTITNEEGQYSFSGTLANGNYILVVSYVGFSNRKIAFTLDQNNQSITLDAQMSNDAMNLDEIVVIGSTLKQTRRTLGNSITTVDGEQLRNTGSTNLLSSLQGKVPGAQITQNSGDPAGGITIRLRGIKSITGNSDPLYVIDGVVVSNSSANVSQTALSNQVGSSVIGTNRLADLNPSDIESINILSGAAAAAVYGSRANNGVVIISTKRGKAGKPQITFNTSYSVNELRKKVYITTYPKQFGFASLRLHTIGAPTAAQIAANPGTTVTNIFRDGTNTALATNLVDVTRYDYQDDIFQKGTGTDNALSISGGSDKTKYFMSLGYMKNGGIVKGTDFGRYNLRARIDQRLTDWAKVSVGLSYINSLANEKANGNVFYSPINSVNITNNIYDINQRDAGGNLKAVEPTRVNPLTTIEEMIFKQRVNRTINDLQLNLTPIKNLSIDWVVGVDAFNALGTNFIPAYPYQAEAGLPAERYPSGFVSNVNAVTLQYNSDINLSYLWNINPDLKVTAVAGTNYQYRRSDFSRGSGEGLSPFIETVNGASTTIGAGYGVGQFALQGIFGQATVNFKDWAYITGAVRRDGSSSFDASQTNQIYPKVSASFILSDLFKDAAISKSLSTLKARFSWGESGGLTSVGDYDRFWRFSAIPYLGRNTFIPSSTLANINLKPERMTETEGGLDIGLIQNRINLGITLYKQSISDLVVNRQLASSTGGTSTIDNVGSMENKGVELALTTQAIKTKDFNWDFTLLYNRNRNKITKLGSPTVAISSSAGAPSFLIEGQPASVFYGFFYAKDANGKDVLTAQNLPQRERGTQTTLLDYAPTRGADGQPSGTFLRKIIGNPNPDWTGSLMTSVNYKKLGLRVLVDAVQGADVFNADKRTRNNVGIGDIAEKEMTGELPRGYVFSLVNIEEYRVDNGSFMKLREIGLSYTLPKLVKGLENLSLNLIGRNLISWDKYNGYDPETNAGGNSDLLRGVDFGNVPIPRTYQFQLTANF
jgi:TonB-linked SusC/RagA family outer membrane protein